MTWIFFVQWRSPDIVDTQIAEFKLLMGKIYDQEMSRSGTSQL